MVEGEESVQGDAGKVTVEVVEVVGFEEVDRDAKDANDCHTVPT